MKYFLIPALLLLAISGFAQNEPRTLLYLTDGSFLKATIEDTLPGQILQVRLTDGSRIELAASLLWQVREITQSDLLLPDGRKILDRGFWSAVGFHTLSARRSSRWSNSLRWGLGAQYAAGYQFSPRLAIGAGLGIDAHEYFFLPVFVEARGNFANMRSIRQKKNERRWFGNLQGPRHRRPLSYSLQLGYNLPATTLFGTNENGETIKGRWLVYPAVGILLPSRKGPAFRLDAGYKIQSYQREYHSPWDGNYHFTDKIVLKSTAIRATWIF
ncbi:MAG: hypothetical protein EPO28_01940 [Saprospiraceae bacterium]|nr:MAG: hypothetical protein EPO28_01940 [Saprospiraceae bacterium]